MDGPKKELIGMFIGELTMEIAKALRMFKPQSLKDAINLARMKDVKVQRMRKSHRQVSNTHSSRIIREQSSNAFIKRLTWDEMQRRRAHYEYHNL